jgi:hypothetical protein
VVSFAFWRAYWTAAWSWLWPSAAPETAPLVASAFWIASIIGFVIAALAYWFGWGDASRAIAIGSAVVRS